MKAVFRRELGRLFGGFLGWAVAAIVAVSFSVVILMAARAGQAVNGAALVQQARISLVLIGAICAANGFDHERRNGTDRLLRSLPIGSSALTLGKWCALCVPFLCGCALVCVYGVLLRVCAGFAVGAFFAALALYACAGLGVIALGLLVSQWTRFAIVNALIAAAILMAMVFSRELSSLVLASKFASPAALIAVAAALLILGLAATRDFGYALALALVGELAALLLLNGNAPALTAFWTGAAGLFSAFAWFAAPAEGVLDLRGVLYSALLAAVCLTLAAIGWRIGALRVRRHAE